MPLFYYILLVPSTLDELAKLKSKNPDTDLTVCLLKMRMKTDWRHWSLYLVLGIAIALPYFGLWRLYKWYANKTENILNANFIVADKSKMTLSLYDYQGRELMVFPMACGKNPGDKHLQGDMRTPEGVFHVESIENASLWIHDFDDGNGEVEGAYGPLFIRLDCKEYNGIGIHGTHLPESIGTRSTEGCIRLNNDDLLQLAERVHVGTVVAILPSATDVGDNN